MSVKVPASQIPLVQAFLLSASVSVGLYVARMLVAGTPRYSFLVWNLVLAWVPALIGWWLATRLKRQSWSSPANISITVLWVLFLPNSFYLVSDLIHLQTSGDINILYDAVMFMSFIANAFFAGFLSVYLMHRMLLKRLGRRAHVLIGTLFLVCGFAVYLGRSLRWNSWDVLLHPAGILFDVSDRILNPVAHPQAIVTTLTFTTLVGSMYLVIWQVIQAMRKTR
jgi:uncharacterized membrane protein